MHIGIDLSLAATKRAGVANYAYNLAKALIEADSQNQYSFYSHCEVSGLQTAKKSNVRLVYPKFKVNRHIWFQTLLPFNFMRDGIDVFHGTNFMTPLLADIQSVITIHDLSFLIYPGTQTFMHGIYRKLIPLSIKNSSKIIVPSNSVKEEIVKYFGVSEEKIVVTYEGVGKEYKVIKDQEKLSSIRQKYSLPKRFILYVSTLEPRKNVVKLIEAFSLLKGKRIGEKLVIVGKKGWLYRKIFERVEELEIDQDVVFTGYIPEEDLPYLYNLATVFVYSSLYEGFGLPILEAMACGVPVVISNISSLMEVAGGAALLVDPKDTQSIADIIKKVLVDSSLRNDLINKGLQRAKEFTWEKCAKDTLRVYNSIYHDAKSH